MDRRKPLLAVLVLVAVTLPVFFEIYRGVAFKPAYDNLHAAYLLVLASVVDAEVQAPWGYRLLSVAPALIPFHLLPSYVFSDVPPTIDRAYLQALQALAAVSYVAIVAASLLQYAAARRLGASQGASLVVLAATWFGCGFLARSGVDPLAVAWIAVLVLLSDRPRWFVPLVLLSAFGNEKIPLVLASLHGARALSGGTASPPRAVLISSLAAVACYVGVRLAVPLPGSAEQLDPFGIPGAIVGTLADTFSAKGLVLNLLPVVLVGLLYLAARRLPEGTVEPRWFHRTDVAPLCVLVLLAFATDVRFNVGRIAMHAFPPLLPLLALHVDRLFVRER